MEKQKRLSINGATVLADKYIYFAINNGNGLFCFNLIDKKLTFLGIFPGEDREQHDLYYTAVKYHNFLLFPPHCAKKFAVYDIEKNIFTEWDFLPEMKNREVGRAVLYKDKIFLFGTWVNPYLLKIDLSNKEMFFHETWMKKIHPEGRGEKCRISTTGMNQNGPNLFLTATTSNGAEVVCFDMETETIKQIAVPIYPQNFEWIYATAYGNEDKVWVIIDKNGEVLEIDRKTKSFATYNTFIEKKARRNNFLRIFQEGSYLILIPYMAYRILKMNVDTKGIMPLFCEKEDELEEYEYGEFLAKYSWCEYKHGKLYLFRRFGLALEIVDILENHTEEVKFIDRTNVATLFTDQKGVFSEGLTINNGLAVYMSEIEEENSAMAKEIVENGKVIYNFLMH